ncbi:reverse transcriptase domain-containing protein [Tanacetum coccineum]
MWESPKTVAPNPNSAIVQPNVDDNFVINSTHLNMIRENKFDGYLRADPHDHIREFIAICNMFKYGETQSEAIKLLIFPYSLSDKAKTWFNELNEESITSWEQMRKAFINRFFPHSLFNRLLLEIRNFSQLTNLKTPNQAFQFLEDKVLFNLDWSTKSRNKHHQKSVAFADGSDSNDDNYRLMEKLEALKMDSQFQSLKDEMNETRDVNHVSKNDDTLMCERHYIQYEGNKNRNSQDSYSYQSHYDRNDSEKSLAKLNNDVKNDLEDFKRCIHNMRTVHDKLFTRDDGKTTGVLPNKKSKIVNQEPQSKTNFEKSITKFLDGQGVTNMVFKNNVNDMILKIKQNEKNFQIKIKKMERKMDEWSKSQNISPEQTDKTKPQPPPQAQTKQVNVVFTGSGKSDDPSKTQKESPPPIIKESIESESHKSSTQHSSVNDFVVIDIHEEDVEPKQIILDPDDQPMWESPKTVAPNPNYSIVQPNVDDNFVINSTNLNMIRENKFDGYLRADPHDHIREFLAICNMFKYGETQSEAIKLLIFPYSLSDKAKTWFNKLNEESITSWEQMRKAFINRFFPHSLFNRLLLEIRNFSQLVCESLTDAWLRLKSMLRKCHGHGLTKGAIIQIFYHGLDKRAQRILDVTAGGIFLKTPNLAF